MTMPEDNPLIALTALLLRAAAHRQRYAHEDKGTLLQEVLARARGPQAHLQDWWRHHTGVRELATVIFPPRPPAALSTPRVRAARQAVGQHLRALLTTTDSGETILHVEAQGPQWAGALLLLSWQPHETRALQQGLVLLEHPSPPAWYSGAIRLGRLTDEAEIVVAEHALDIALLHEVPVTTVQTSVDRAVDRRGWRLWYRQQGDTLAPVLRQAIATALEASSRLTSQRPQGDTRCGISTTN
jgi:hypothetical protein